MKRFGFITLAVLTAVFFSSCNDSDGDYASSWAFASAETLSNDYYFVLDDDKTVYPSDKSRVAGYKPEDDQRVIIFFNLLKTGVEGYDYNIALYDCKPNIQSQKRCTMDSLKENISVPLKLGRS